MDHFCYLSFVFVFFHAVLSVSCSLVVTCWERADLLTLLYVMFSCVFVTFPYGVLGQVIVSILDLCFLLYFVQGHNSVPQVRLKQGTFRSQVEHSIYKPGCAKVWVRFSIYVYDVLFRKP